MLWRALPLLLLLCQMSAVRIYTWPEAVRESLGAPLSQEAFARFRHLGLRVRALLLALLLALLIYL